LGKRPDRYLLYISLIWQMALSYVF
jgi:hypothetical protein